MRIRKKRLLDLLAVKQMTVAGLALQLGVSRQYLWQVLSDDVKRRRRLSLKCTKRLIDLFGADLVAQIADWGAMKIINPFAGGARESI